MTHNNNHQPDYQTYLPPAWAFGVLYGTYQDQEGTLKKAQALVDSAIPIDALWVDSTFWDQNYDGPKGYINFIGDKKAFPNPKKLWSKLHDLNIANGIWIWDRILKEGNEDVFNDFKKKGFFHKVEPMWEKWHTGPNKPPAGYVDFKNPKAASYWKSKLKPFFEDGLDFMKLDANTDLHYLETHHQATAEFGQWTKGRGLILAHLGDLDDPSVRRYPARWTGDAKIAWNQPNYPQTNPYAMGGLAQQVQKSANPGDPSYKMPFFSHDIGGFCAGEPESELLVRWAQFGAFSRMCHFFGERTLWTNSNDPMCLEKSDREIVRKHLKLRIDLFPYLYSEAIKSRLHGTYITEGDGAHVDQLRFGPFFHVAPVIEKDARERWVYLDKGNYTDWWTGESFRSGMGQAYRKPAPLEQIPLYVKHGAIIPLRESAPNIRSGNNQLLTLEVFPEAGNFSYEMIEDDGVSNGYIKGEFARTEFSGRLSEKHLELTIAEQDGTFEGAIKSRDYLIKCRHTKAKEITGNGNPIKAYKSLNGLKASKSGWFFEEKSNITWIKAMIDVESGAHFKALLS